MINKLIQLSITLLISLHTFNCMATDLDEAESLNDAGHTAQILRKLDEAISNYDKLINRFGSSRDIELQVKVAYALTKKSQAFLEKNELDIAIVCDDEIIKKFENSQDVRLHNFVASAMAGKGIVFTMQSKLDDAIIYLDKSILKNRETIKILNKMIEASSPPVLIYSTPDYQISSALLFKGNIYSQQNKHDLAIASFDEVIKDFSASADFNVEDVVRLAKTLKDQELAK